MFTSSVYADQQLTNVSKIIRLLPSNIPTATLNSFPDGYAMGYAFSHDGRLFASFFAGKRNADNHTNGSIQIWETKTGKLKYQTAIPTYYNTYRGDRYDIKFSPDNKMLYLASTPEAQVFIWQFTKRSKIEVLCYQSDRAEFSDVIQVAPNNKQLLMQGLSDTQLCTKETLTNDKSHYAFGYYASDATSVLHNNKLLVIYNKKRMNNDAIAKNKQELKDLSKRKIVDFWEVNGESNALPIMDKVDIERELFIIVEELEGTLQIKQWNYAKRQWLGKQTFTGFDNVQVKLYQNYLIVYSKDKIVAVFKRNGWQFSLLWKKASSSLPDFASMSLSLDENYIIADLNLIDIQTGQFKSRNNQRKNKQNAKALKPPDEFYTIYVEPSLTKDDYARYAPDKISCTANENTHTNIYSLMLNRVVKQIDGLVLDISPNGKTLAVCQGSELFLMPLL